MRLAKISRLTVNELGFVGKLRRRPENEQLFRLARLVPSASVGNSKQAMLVLSSMQPDSARRRNGRSKPERVFRHSLVFTRWPINAVTFLNSTGTLRLNRQSETMERQ